MADPDGVEQVRHPTEASAADLAIQALVRQLIAVLIDNRLPAASVRHEAGQLLDIEVDGVRCRCAWVTIPMVDGGVALSPREREIARMVAKGHTNQAIADVLGISAWTVSTHLRRVFGKLGVNSRAAMVATVLDSERRTLPGPQTVPTDNRPSAVDTTPVRVTHG